MPGISGCGGPLSSRFLRWFTGLEIDAAYPVFIYLAARSGKGKVEHSHLKQRAFSQIFLSLFKIPV
jgi:hypothetical protein